MTPPDRPIFRLATLAAVTLALGLPACGRKGALDAPPSAAIGDQAGAAAVNEPEEQRSFVERKGGARSLPDHQRAEQAHSARRSARLRPPCITSTIATAVLHAEAVPVADIAKAVGTPFYCYSTATLERHYSVFADAFADVPSLVCYAVKANSNQAVIATLARLGAGADVVSEGELRRARSAGMPPKKIMFSGIGKTERELALAVDEGILCVNVESEPELELLSSIAKSKGKQRRHLRSRQSRHRRENPPQDRDRKIREQVRHSDQPRARRLRRRRQASGHSRRRRRYAYRQPDHRADAVRGCLRACCRISCALCALMATPSTHVDLGGGLGIPYREADEAPPIPSAYADIVKKATRDLGCKLIFEPGRLIVGNAGILVTRVLYREARRGQDLRDRRCGDERSHPPDAV